MRHLIKLFFLPALLSACSGSGDWRADAIAGAEGKMRGLISDASATFGDSSTGQTCGVITAKVGAFTKEARFIVYIDNTAGPFVEPGMGQSMSRADFDWAWRNDCLNEGYKS
ncbi:hypothetical protein NKJ59_20090 [Mesorhizobium australicum]|uniref:hypothetical protein n=1 Tax=Mesorhizobium australicum TaxID=536018 RepID=UPI003339D461